MSANLFEFPSNSSGRLVNLAYANGFLPETYQRALLPLFGHYRVVAAHMRPLWTPPVAPGTLHSWRQLGDDLLNALDKLTDQPVVEIGHSVGAVATLYAAQKRPERFSQLVLIEPAMLRRPYLWGIQLLGMVGQLDRLPPVKQALRRGRSWPDSESAFRYFRGKTLFARCDDEMVRAYCTSITSDDGRGGLTLRYSADWEAQIFRTMAADEWSLPAAVKTPLILICGADTDVFVPACIRRFTRLNPAAQLITLPATGHLVPQERPDQVGAALVDFLLP